VSKIHIEPNYVDVKPVGYYVYLHKRKSIGSIMHVGKGKGNRGFSHQGRNRYWLKSAEKHGILVEIVQDGMLDKDAMLLEMWLIAKFRHSGERLTNLTDGGEGASGFKQSAETIRKRSEKMSGKNHPLYGRKMSKEHCDRLSLAHIGKNLGRDSASARLDMIHFRHIDGDYFHGIMSEFRVYSGLTSGGVSRIANNTRKHEKGWYVSEVEKPASEIMGKRTFLPDGRLANEMTVYSNLGESFTTAAQAAIIVSGPKASGELIISACLGLANTAYGRTWSFNEYGPFLEYVDPRRVSGDAKLKTIECSNGMIFIGAQPASEWLSEYCGRTISKASIYQAISKGGNSGGYKWRYIDG